MQKKKIIMYLFILEYKHIILLQCLTLFSSPQIGNCFYSHQDPEPSQNNDIRKNSSVKSIQIPNQQKSKLQQVKSSTDMTNQASCEDITQGDSTEDSSSAFQTLSFPIHRVVTELQCQETSTTKKQKLALAPLPQDQSNQIETICQNEQVNQKTDQKQVQIIELKEEIIQEQKLKDAKILLPEKQQGIQAAQDQDAQERKLVIKPIKTGQDAFAPLSRSRTFSRLFDARRSESSDCTLPKINPEFQTQNLSQIKQQQSNQDVKQLQLLKPSGMREVMEYQPKSDYKIVFRPKTILNLPKIQINKIQNPYKNSPNAFQSQSGIWFERKARPDEGGDEKKFRDVCVELYINQAAKW